MMPRILSSTFHFPEVMLNIITRSISSCFAVQRFGCSVSDSLAILRQAQDGVCPEYKVVSEDQEVPEDAFAGGRGGRGEGMIMRRPLLVYGAFGLSVLLSACWMHKVHCSPRNYPGFVIDSVAHTILIGDYCGVGGMTLIRLPDTVMVDRPSLVSIQNGEWFGPAGTVNAYRREHAAWPIMQERRVKGTWSDQMTAQLDDSLATRYPRYSTDFKGLLSPIANDSLLFLPWSPADDQEARPMSLTELNVPGHWYALKIYDDHVVHWSKVWYVWYHLDAQRNVTEWHEVKTTEFKA